MDEYRKAQPVSGYPIKLPLGLKKLRSHDNPEVIRAFADILGSLMQPTDRLSVDHLKTHEFTSSLTINMLTMNHGNLTRNPKLDGRDEGPTNCEDDDAEQRTHLLPRRIPQSSR